LPITGIYEIDSLIGYIPRGWIVEFYGDYKVVKPLMHQTLAYQSKYYDTLLIHSREFGGLDPYLLNRLVKRSNGDIDRIHVVRGFRLQDVIESLINESLGEYGVIVLAYPYRYVPGNPAAYTEASRITGLIKKLAVNRRVIVFNEVSKNGYYYPDGGSLHHHTVHVIVGVWARPGDRVTIRLFKHPWKPVGLTTTTNYNRIIGEKPWVAQHRLTEWLYIKN